MFLQIASHLGYIKTTTLPPISRVSLSQKLQPPPPKFPKNSPKPFQIQNSSETLARSDPGRQIRPTKGPRRHIVAPKLQPPASAAWAPQGPLLRRRGPPQARIGL